MSKQKTKRKIKDGDKLAVLIAKITKLIASARPRN